VYRPCRVTLPPCLRTIPATTLETPTPPPNGRPPVGRGMAAGMMLVAALVVCTAAGAGLGALVGAVAPLTILGVFAGFAAGLWAVISRFRDL
jgi:hypothetical protein